MFIFFVAGLLVLFQFLVLLSVFGGIEVGNVAAHEVYSLFRAPLSVCLLVGNYVFYSLLACLERRTAAAASL